MLLGHYAAALAAKQISPKTSLGTLVAAALFLDLVWPVLVLLGYEELSIPLDTKTLNPIAFTSYPWSHSLVMAALWGLLLGTLYLWRKHNRVGALVVGLLVLSHWFLDWVVHVPDLPLSPWGAGRHGLGMWHSYAATLAIELGLFTVGAWVYFGATTPKDRKGKWGFWAFVGILLMIFWLNTGGEHPPDTTTVAWMANGQWLLVFFAAWIDRHRALNPLAFAPAAPPIEQGVHHHG